MATFGERDLENPDPMRLNREVERTAGLFARFRRRQRRGEGLDEDPFFSGRLIAGRSAFVAARELPSGDPLRGPLLRWIHHLADGRINLEVTSRIAAERYVAEHVVNQPEHGRLTLASMMRRALTEPRRREAWLESYLSRCETLGDTVAIHWERRAEIASRLGLANIDEMEGAGADVYAAAERWLSRSGDAFASVARESLASVLSLALADEAPGEFPRYLVPRTILDMFRETDLLRSVDLDPDPLPEPLAPASMARALSTVFAAFVDATAPRDQPFVIAHDPCGLRRHTFAALFGALPGEASFARRVFQVDPSRAGDYRRKFAGAFLVQARVAALRVLLRRSALHGRKNLEEAFEEGTGRALGVPLPPHARGALFGLHHDDLQRFAGLLLAASRAMELRDEYDEDWYRNPRFVERTRDETRLSPAVTTTDDALAQGESALYEALAAAL